MLLPRAEFIFNKKLSGFVYPFHPAARGSSPNHTTNAFINLYLICIMQKRRNKQKEAWIGPIKNKNIIIISTACYPKPS